MAKKERMISSEEIAKRGKMKCIFYKKDFSRCRKPTPFLFCKKHWIAFVILLLIAVPSTLVTYFELSNKVSELSNDDYLVFNIVEISAKYPSRFLYTYDSKYGVLGAPVSNLLYIEFVNNSEKQTSIVKYRLEINYNDEWISLPVLTVLNSTSIYFATRDGYSKCRRYDFRETNFLQLITQKNIGVGESIRGWIFCELPKELRHTELGFAKKKIFINDVYNNNYEFELEERSILTPDEIGYGAEMKVFDNLLYDLSSIPIVPNIDLHEYFRKEKRKQSKN